MVESWHEHVWKCLHILLWHAIIYQEWGFDNVQLHPWVWFIMWDSWRCLIMWNMISFIQFMEFRFIDWGFRCNFNILYYSLVIFHPYLSKNSYNVVFLKCFATYLKYFPFTICGGRNVLFDLVIMWIIKSYFSFETEFAYSNQEQEMHYYYFTQFSWLNFSFEWRKLCPRLPSSHSLMNNLQQIKPNDLESFILLIICE